MTDERVRIVTKALNDIDGHLSALGSLTCAEMRVIIAVQSARTALSELDNQRNDERDRLEAEVNRWHAEAISAQLELVRRRAEADSLRARVRYLETMQQSFLMCIDRLAIIFSEANRKKILAWLDDCALIRDAKTWPERQT